MEAQGKLELFQIATKQDGTEITGVKKDGTPYTMYKYKIGGKFYSGFKTLSAFEPPIEIGDYVIVVYTEAPNPNSPNPYKNITNITQAVSPSELKEENEKVNLKPVGEKPTEPKAVDYNEGAFYGMVSNQTLTWLKHLEAVDKIKLNKDNFKVTWDGIFETFWKLNLEKRKEKLE